MTVIDQMSIPNRACKAHKKLEPTICAIVDGQLKDNLLYYTKNKEKNYSKIKVKTCQKIFPIGICYI